MKESINRNCNRTNLERLLNGIDPTSVFSFSDGRFWSGSKGRRTGTTLAYDDIIRRFTKPKASPGQFLAHADGLVHFLFKERGEVSVAQF